jgi:hypothetical protein
MEYFTENLNKDLMQLIKSDQYNVDRIRGSESGFFFLQQNITDPEHDLPLLRPHPLESWSGVYSAAGATRADPVHSS